MHANKLFQTLTLSLGRAMPGLIFLLLSRQAEANPTGLTVQSGSATAAANGSRLTVTAGNNAVLNWQSFNIAPGETTIFHQPSAASIVWNHINNGQNPSQIYGSLQANGVVVLLNSAGFYFGPNAFVSAAGLVVSTANCSPPQNAGGAWEFNGPPPLASIVNYGQIKIGENGSCFLIADQIENHGTIAAPGGSVGLAAGQTVSLSERPDGRGVSMKVTLPQGAVDNYGTLVADAGTISLNAKVVNQDGLLQANSVRNDQGVIELIASDQLNLGADSKIVANGDGAAGGSAGGTITLQSKNNFSDARGSAISVTGGANGGNGGAVEISAPAMPAIHSTIDGSAQAGFIGGKLVLDPDFILLDTSGGDSVGAGGTVVASDNPGSTLDLNVNAAFTGFSKISLQAAYDITLVDGTSWSLSDSTGQTSGQLVLEAGRNIIFGNNTALYDLNSWSIALYAGVTTFSSTPGVAPTVTAGAGSIYLNAFDPNNPNEVASTPNGSIQTAAGAVTLVAGQDLIVGTGFVNTTAGGSITAHALAGNIDTGTFGQGYIFQSATSASGGYYVDPTGVGGISTMAGGDVNLTAGGDVISQLPGPRSTAEGATAGCGAYGVGSGQIGNVNIVAGGDVLGNYVVANGTGKIFAGVLMDANGNPVEDATGKLVLGATGNAGTSSQELALNLISGGWNVTAAQDIYLQEVRNPNGVFNAADSSSGSFHAFDYAPADYVNLTAGNMAQLGASAAALPRVDTTQVPMIYPGILDITAGAGGVVLEGDPSRAAFEQLILFPSPLGSLTINTTDGGSLVSGLPSSAPQLFSLIVSDSGRSQYNPPSQSAGYFGLNDHASSPVHLNSEQPINLNISGDLNSLKFGFAEASAMNVVGNMENCSFQGMNLAGSDVTSIDVGATAKTSLENNGILDPATDGNLLVGGNIGTQGTGGYVIGGGGTFELNAANLDLGTSIGIQSKGFGLYRANGVYTLASLFSQGANIDINLTGDLSMYSSAIASLAGAGISIYAGGKVEVGASGVAVTVLGARGIYTTGQGNVSVIADGDIDVAGSRIAAYDGGNVTVESLDGNINAGIGGTGFVTVYSYEVNSTTHTISVPSPTIPGSGILATTFPDDYGQAVGNILVETPRGTINASAGGIVQLPLNNGSHAPTTGQPNPPPSLVEVLAGYELRDSAGKAVSAANISTGTPVQVASGENIEANGSGVIGGTVSLKATGNIDGAIFARNNLEITAQQNINVIALAEGTISVSSGGTVSGTLIGVGGVSASGSSIDASLESNNGISGDTSGAKGLAPGTAANATSASASASDSTATAAAKTENSGEDDLLKKKKPIALARKVSRVTVLLPGKN